MLLSAFAPRLLLLPRPMRRAAVRLHRPAEPAPVDSQLPPQAPAVPDAATTGIREVLTLLRDQLGLEAVYVRRHDQAGRRYRVVQALHHGPAAARATGAAGEGELLEADVVLAGGVRDGALCCLAPAAVDPAERERLRRVLRHGAKLAGRLLDNEAVLRDLARQADAA